MRSGRVSRFPRSLERVPPSLNSALQLSSCSMVEAVAGPRGRNFSQGRVGGILQQLGYTEKEVVKL